MSYQLQYEAKCRAYDILKYEYDHSFQMTLEETKSVIKELGQTFIDRENELCSQVLTKMIQFVDRYEKLDK